MCQRDWPVFAAAVRMSLPGAWAQNAAVGKAPPWVGCSIRIIADSPVRTY
jgi:hypothetical protein